MTHLRSRLLHSAIALALLLQPLLGQPYIYASRVRMEPRLSVTGLRTEYQINPVGIDVREPRLTWQLRSEARGVKQTAYQVRVASIVPDWRKAANLVWDSGRISSDESAHCPYKGQALQSGRRYYWQVRVWDDGGAVSEWSETAYWEMGLLNASDWQASWIEPDLREDVTKPHPAPLLRREFQLHGVIEQARAYVTSHGLYEMQLNGQRIGDQLFTPGWTSYKKRLQYQTYDVTKLLRNGANAVGVTVGDGWYRGNIGFSGQRNYYGEHAALLLQIKVTYQGGREEVIGTDANWKTATGPILMSEIYNGETYDARLEQPGWANAGFADTQWSGVHIANHPKDNLIAPAGPPVKKIEELKPINIFKTPAGEIVADLGQNMVGWVRLKVQGTSGTTVTLRHAEVLDSAGNFYTANLRAAKETVQYTLKGGAAEIFEPHFTFQGFRYVAVEGYPGELNPASITGIVIHSDMARTGAFETSKPAINQLQHNIIWGQKGNFLDVPTDCPQRDERLGWTGDAQVFSRTAAFNMDVAGFFTKWLKDVAADQFETGSVPYVVPNVLGNRAAGPPGGSAAWADAAVIIPWNIYLSYGDTRVLAEQYESMARWVEYERQRAGDDYIWSGDFHFGDWLAFATNRADYPGATTSKDLIATAFFAHSTDLLQRTAAVLGKRSDADAYAELLVKIKAAFCREFVTATGRVGEDTQTAYALALQFDLLPEDLRPIAAKRLANEVRTRGHLTTGFVGTPYLCQVLSRYGYLDEAYLLLNRDQYPSWLYPIKQGATTIWERWDGQKPDGSFQDKGMNSFNHYAYGAIGEWMYRVMAGIEIDEAAPGYKHILIQPQPGGGFANVKATHDTMYGAVSSAWKLSEDRFELALEIPANTSATVRLPRTQLANVLEGGQALTNRAGIGSARQNGDDVIVEIGSGRYLFLSPVTKPGVSLGQREASTAPAADEPTPRSDANSQIAHAQLLEKARKGGIDIYFEGDSITRRWGTSDDQYKIFLANWRQNFFGWNAADFGWGGDTTQNILWRLKNGELDNVNPKIIVLMAGTNNVGKLSPQGSDDPRVAQVSRGIKAILDICRQKAPNATIVLMGITPRNDNVAVMSIINRINDNIARFADGKKIKYLNINDKLADKAGKLFEGMTNGDGLHLDVKGYQVWADALKPIFAEVLGPPAKEDHAPPPTGDPSAKKI